MMDVKKPFNKMIGDEDMDTAIYFLDSKVQDRRFRGPIGENTRGRS